MKKWIVRMALLLIMVCVNRTEVAFAMEGDIAYEYLKHIDATYPNRIAGTDGEYQFGEYLLGELRSFGYEPIIHDFTVGELPSRNIIIDKAGNSKKQIIIGAHYDSVETKGVDDNGSGVSLLLELAKTLKDKETPCSIRFIFFGAEEPGVFGSFEYAKAMTAEDIDKTVAMINIDTIIAGDVLYVHGGEADENGKLARGWLLDEALKIVEQQALVIYTQPGTPKNPAQTRTNSSDQTHFNNLGIPYLFFEANLYDTNEDVQYPYFYQTSDERVTDGKVMHTEFDSLATIEELFPGRAKSSLNQYMRLANALVEVISSDMKDLHNHETRPLGDGVDTMTDLVAEYPLVHKVGEVVDLTQLLIFPYYNNKKAILPATGWSAEDIRKPLVEGENQFEITYSEGLRTMTTMLTVLATADVGGDETRTSNQTDETKSSAPTQQSESSQQINHPSKSEAEKTIKPTQKTNAPTKATPEKPENTILNKVIFGAVIVIGLFIIASVLFYICRYEKSKKNKK